MHAIAEPIAALWERTRAMLARALAEIRAPAALAAARTLSEGRRRVIARWLGLLEHIVRKLLLAEAAALHSQGWSASPPARNGACVAKESAAGAARSNPDPSRPETWPARFSFALPRDPLAAPEARAPRIRALWGDTPAQTAPSKRDPAPRTRKPDAPLRLAFRLEALRRVIEDYAPHARRLARCLLRLRRRFPDVIRRFALAAARVCFFDPKDDRLSIHACAMALDAAYSFTDSS